MAKPTSLKMIYFPSGMAMIYPMIDDSKAAKLIAQLGLQPHPEGGFFVETFRSSLQLSLADGRCRAASTAIYFLLPCNAFSSLHQVTSDEIWHYYDGEPLELTTITPEGILEHVILGKNFAAGQMPQHVVPRGVWQGARPLRSAGIGYTLVGCTVAPGFDFEDFTMLSRAGLELLFPQHVNALRALTRDESSETSQGESFSLAAMGSLS
jgi:hypothetical protein